MRCIPVSWPRSLIFAVGNPALRTRSTSASIRSSTWRIRVSADSARAIARSRKGFPSVGMLRK